MRYTLKGILVLLMVLFSLVVFAQDDYVYEQGYDENGNFYMTFPHDATFQHRSSYTYTPTTSPTYTDFNTLLTQKLILNAQWRGRKCGNDGRGNRSRASYNYNRSGGSSHNNHNHSNNKRR